jgi:tetrahydromethanopterin S-methyltransferase subunit G
MENELDSFIDNTDQESHLDPSVTEGNLIVSILTKPTATIRFLLHLNTEKHVLLLFFLAAVRNAFDQVLEKVDFTTGSDYQIGYIVGGVIGGGLFGVVLYYLYASLMAAFGRWVFNGSGTSSQFRVVLAWSVIPVLFGFALYIPQYFLTSAEFVTESEYLGSILLMLVGVAQLTLAIWSIVIMVKGTQVVQRFDGWKAFFNVILPGILFIVIIVAIAMSFTLF